MINRLVSPRIIFALSLLLIAAACGGSTLVPVSATLPAASPTVSLNELPLIIGPPVVASTAVSPAPQILESRRLTLEYPTRMRAGVDTDVVRLTLEVDGLGDITPTAEISGHTVSGQVIQIPDAYDTQNVTAEARLDMAGFQIQPADSVFEPLTRRQSAAFLWSVRAPDPGSYRGTIWLHLNFTDKSSGEASRIAVSAQFIQVEAVDFFGLSANVARTSGILGSVVGGVIGFPFIEEILKFLFGKRKK